MKTWIPGWELRERLAQWDISLYNIVDIIVNGELTAYNLLDHTPMNIDIEKQTRDKLIFLEDEIGLMGLALCGKNLDTYRKDEKEELVRSVTLGIDGFLFKITEVEEYERAHGLIPQSNQAESPDPSELSQVDRLNTAAKQYQQRHGVPEKAPTQNTTAENPLPQNHNGKPLFSTQVWQEAVRLYEILRETGFGGSDVEKKLQSAAKKELNQNRKLYKYIKQKHLDKTDLFALNPGQERRDFIGKLLQRIVGKGEKNNYIGAQRLYDFGKKHYRNHN